MFLFEPGGKNKKRINGYAAKSRINDPGGGHIQVHPLPVLRRTNLYRKKRLSYNILLNINFWVMGYVCNQ